MNLAWMFLPRNVIDRVFRPSHPKKLVFFLLADSAITVTSLLAAFLIRFDFTRDVPSYAFIVPAIPLFLVVKVASFATFRLYTLSWRFVSLRDAYNVVRAVLFSSLALAAILYPIGLSRFTGFPRSVLLIDGILTFILVAALRIAKRVALEVVRGARYAERGKRTIIIGAGNTGEMVLRDIQRTQSATYAPAAFLDDDANLVGSHLHGIRVYGRLDDLVETIRDLQATVVIIAIQSLGHQRLRTLYRRAKDAGILEVKIVPRLYDVHQPQVRLQALEDIKIEDLIRRQAVRVDTDVIGKTLVGKTVLITGAGGSIGAEIVRQVCRFNPRALILFEIDETELHRMALALEREFRSLVGRLRFVVGDIRDVDRVEATFERFRPDLVFHAAAYKHVPMMEENPSEAVKVNVVGTRNVARAAHLVGSERFILISTDKAVRPASIMGATKRVAEHVCRAFNGVGRTAFLAVRFGNVLGSRGSVLPIFLEQLQRGGPLTITHEEMRRYFMTIPEAVALVLEASAIGHGGETLVLDMGDPVRIVEFAEELIRLHRLRPYTDIGIEYIGIRPGEKLFEEILTAEEGTITTKHEQIFVVRAPERLAFAEAETLVERFHNLARFPDVDGRTIRRELQRCVPWYDTAPPAPHASAPPGTRAPGEVPDAAASVVVRA